MELPQGVVAWWPFDETGGTTADDIMGSNDGDIQGAVPAAGWVDGAFEFDGANDIVVVPNHPTLSPNRFTLEVWIYPDSLYSARIFNKNSYALKLYQEPGRFTLVIYWPDGAGSILRSPDPVVTTGEWQHIAGTYDGVRMTLYHNGQIVAKRSESRTPAETDLALMIGKRGPAAGEPFDGRIDEPTLYSRALLPEEVEAIYLAGQAGKCKPGPVTVDSRSWGSVKVTYR